MDELKKQHPWLTESELTAYAALPKKEDGKTFDLEAMDAEQRALYYKDRADAQAAGFNGYKTTKDKELSEAKAEIEKLKKGGGGDGKNRSLTEEELEDVVPGYAGLSEREKDLVKSTIAPFAKNVSALSGQVAKLLDQQRFGEELTALLADPKYKVLIKHKEAFKTFAYTDENLNTPLRTLANSYIYENELKAEPEETAEEKEARLGLEDGGGSGGKVPVKDTYTSEELAKIRTTDPRRYARLAKAGKLGKSLE